MTVTKLLVGIVLGVGALVAGAFYASVPLALYSIGVLSAGVASLLAVTVAVGWLAASCYTAVSLFNTPDSEVHS